MSTNMLLLYFLIMFLAAVPQMSTPMQQLRCILIALTGYITVITYVYEHRFAYIPGCACAFLIFSRDLYFCCFDFIIVPLSGRY